MKKVGRKPQPIRLAIIGTGGMARTHAKNFQAIRGCEIVAIAEPHVERRAAFAGEFGVPAAYATSAELLSGVEFDAVSIVTPDAFHAETSIACLRAGKHVLCEKPLALNHGDALRMVRAARAAGTINMVNLSYRNWPCIQAVAALIGRGDIGEVVHVEASYLQTWLTSTIWGDWRTTPAWLWRLSKKHGSNGVLGDIGVHIVDFATYPVGGIRKVYAQLKAFSKAPQDRVGEYVLDANDSAVLNVEFSNGALGTIHTTRWASGHANRLFLKISGTRGAVEIDSERSIDTFRLCAGKDLDAARWKDVKAARTPNVYARFITSIRTGEQGQPDFARGAEVQQVLDACFESSAVDMPVKLKAARG
jgi:predicted dehydrogenase